MRFAHTLCGEDDQSGIKFTGLHEGVNRQMHGIVVFGFQILDFPVTRIWSHGIKQVRRTIGYRLLRRTVLRSSAVSARTLIREYSLLFVSVSTMWASKILRICVRSRAKHLSPLEGLILYTLDGLKCFNSSVWLMTLTRKVVNSSVRSSKLNDTLNASAGPCAPIWVSYV